MQEGQFDFLYREKIGNVSSIFYLGKRLGTMELGIKMEKKRMLCYVANEENLITTKNENIKTSSLNELKWIEC